MNIKRILVPVDESEYARNALRHALDLARDSDAEIIVLNCHRPVPSSLGEPNFQQVLDAMTANSQAVLDSQTSVLQGQGVPYSERIVAGDTAQVIADVCRGEKCDMIVIGSKGKSDLEGFFLGSVTHKVLQLTHCPVLVVR